MKRLLVPPLLVVLLAAGSAIARPARAASYAGTWHVSAHLHCIDGPKTVWACSDIASGTAPVMRRAGTTFDYRYSLTLRVRSGSTFTVRANFIYTQTVPHIKAGCNPDQIGNQMNGTCTVILTGSGHIAPGRTHKP